MRWSVLRTITVACTQRAGLQLVAMPPKRAREAVVAEANKRGREAGVKAVKAAEQRGANVINHGAGTMPVDAAAPFNGTRYSLLEDPADAPPVYYLNLHDGARDADGKLFFEDAPEFRPSLTPAECIRKGVFGGCYFNPRGGKPGIFGRDVKVGVEEFPPAWFEGVPESLYLARRYSVPTNCYSGAAAAPTPFAPLTSACGGGRPFLTGGARSNPFSLSVKSGFGQKEWESKGWMHAQDPRGWFQWYCRFYAGRRSHDDARQIQRWCACASPRGRWRNQLCGAVSKSGGASSSRWADAAVSPVIRQTLLHWAYELSEADYRAWQASKQQSK